jgi:transposase
MWTKESRTRYDRSALRYPSDLTDREWLVLGPLIPPAKHGGRPREVDIRAVIGGLLYVLETGCPWRHLPKDFPPKSTVHSYFELWAWDGTLERIHDALYVALREHEGREASPSAAILDSQSAKSAQKGGLRSTRSGSTRARRSKGSSATSSPITRAFSWPRSSTRRASRTATARRSS